MSLQLLVLAVELSELENSTSRKAKLVSWYHYFMTVSISWINAYIIICP